MVIDRAKKEAALYRFAAENGFSIDIPKTAAKVIDGDTLIEAWIAERNADNDPPSSKAIQNKQRKLLAISKHVGKTNIVEITEADLKAFRLDLVKADKLNGTRKTRDYVIDTIALFRTAKGAGFITSNPATDLAVPPKSDKVSQPFTDTEAKVILEAARLAEPTVKWGHWLAAFSTAHNKEILLAHSSEFYQLTTEKWAGQWVWDMRNRKLKTDARPRIMSLHPSLIREGFLDYLATRTGKPLFAGSFNGNDPKLNELIASLKPAISKRFYSWRKRNAHRLAKLAGPELGRYLGGHAAKDIAEKYYRFHELPDEFGDIVKAISGLENPTVSKPT